MAQNSPTVFYHASDQFPEIGTVFAGRGEAYDKEWSGVSFYQVLERYRPKGMTAHRDAVFVCNDTETIGLCGGLGESILLMQVDSMVSWHDMNWSMEISSLVSEGFSIESERVRQAAENYWSGFQHPNGPVWEGIADSARVVAVFPYLTGDSVLESARRNLERSAQKHAA